MYLTILGRQPALSIAEIERVFGANSVKPISKQVALVETDDLDIQRFGGLQKAGVVMLESSFNNWHQLSQKIVSQLVSDWSGYNGKITLGISVYGLPVSVRDIQKTGIVLKQKLKSSGVSLRLIPQNSPSLNTATSHHNKLGLSDNKVELLIARSIDGKVYLAKSTGSQNITSYANRDQKRPKRDAFVGMLPPKLAQIMINLAAGNSHSPSTIPQPPTILDPFCGTGVVLQEAALMGFRAYGSDLSDKMVEYSQTNMEWLESKLHEPIDYIVEQGDAMTKQWTKPIDFVAGETYLGQPFSAPPSPSKLNEVVGNCNHIITEFLINLGQQINPGIQICIAVPAWRNKDGYFTHLPLVSTVARYGYKPHEFRNVSQNDMLYYREDQVVARELLVLTKI